MVIFAVNLVRRSFDYTPLRSVPLRMTHYFSAVHNLKISIVVFFLKK